MIVRQFLQWVKTAPAGERADATRALARAYLISDMTEDDRIAAEGALLMLLDDASPMVREAMAQVFAFSEDAPPAIVHALAQDQHAIAALVLEGSPLFMDVELVDLVATGSDAHQSAIARRRDLPASVSAALAEVGSPQACLELVENPEAQLMEFSLTRIAQRHGHLPAIREAMMADPSLAAPIRLILVGQLSAQLSRFVVGKKWLSEERAELITREASDKAIVNVAAASQGRDLGGLIAHLRASGQLTSGLVLRALLSGNMNFFEQAIVGLSNVPAQRVAALLSERSGAALNALLRKAGFPDIVIPAFAAAINALHEVGYADTMGGMMRLRRTMVERVMTTLAHMPGEETSALLSLLRRFAAESAREEARLFCDELAADDEITLFDRYYGHDEDIDDDRAVA